MPPFYWTYLGNARQEIIVMIIKDVRSGKLLLSLDMKRFTRNPLSMQKSKLD